MNKKLQLLLIILGLAIPYLLVYRALFNGGPLAWGDAPFFSSENLKELFNFPFLWNFKDNNFGAPQYYILWLYLPTFLYGFLNHFFGLGNDILIRLIFYFPATVLSIVGAWLFISKFNDNIWGKFLGSFLYGFNTYILMLTDGGQVGIALSYGLFPLGALTILNYLRHLTIKNYLLAVIVLFFLTSSDIRVALLLAFFVGGIWVIGGVGRDLGKILKRLLLLVLSVLGVSSYWVIPTISSMGLGGVGGLNGGTNFINLTNSLFLFQPHFPLNQFGKTSPPPFYFTLILPLIFGSLLMLSKFKDANERKIVLGISLLFLLFAFLSKGGSEPLGLVYSWTVSNLPLGVAFRDSSKFYIPLILTGSILLSFTARGLGETLKIRWVYGFGIIGIFSYLLFLIHPALLGNLSGGLGGAGEVRGVGEIIKEEEGFFRTLWFEEKPAQSFFNWSHPALSANNLYQERPFASMIDGQVDLYNYLYSPQIKQWLNLLGVKYILFPSNERKKIISEEEAIDRKNLLTLAQTNLGLESATPNNPFSIYLNKDAKPHIFAQNKMFAVVGGEELYRKLILRKNFSLAEQGFIFLEDGKVNPDDLREINPEDMVLIFENKGLMDLTMSYLQDFMTPTDQFSKSQWMFRKSQDYLKWKYDLLKQNIRSYEFDYGKGVVFSTIAGEKMNFNFPVVKNEEYYLAVRSTNILGGGIKLIALSQEEIITNNNPWYFKWHIRGPFKVPSDSISVDIINSGNFAMVNTVAVIPKEKFQEAEKKAGDLSNRFQRLEVRDEKDWQSVLENVNGIISEVNYKQVNPTEYEINVPLGAKWLVFSDHFHKDWRINNSRSIHLPFYSIINGFYLKEVSSSFKISFIAQDNVSNGVAVAIVSAILILIITLSLYIKKLERKR